MKKNKLKHQYAVQLWKGVDSQWYWHIVSTVNGQIILTSEGYKSKRNAKKSIDKWMTSVIENGILFEELNLEKDS